MQNPPLKMTSLRSLSLTGTVWPGSRTGTPFTNLPILGPTAVAPTRATVPPRA